MGSQYGKNVSSDRTILHLEDSGPLNGKYNVKEM